MPRFLVELVSKRGRVKHSEIVKACCEDEIEDAVYQLTYWTGCNISEVKENTVTLDTFIEIANGLKK